MSKKKTLTAEEISAYQNLYVAARQLRLAQEGAERKRKIEKKRKPARGIKGLQKEIAEWKNAARLRSANPTPQTVADLLLENEKLLREQYHLKRRIAELESGTDNAIGRLHDMADAREN